MWYWGLLEVERVVNVLPQEQVTLMSLYLGWMSDFSVFSWCPRAAVVTALIGKGGDYQLQVRCWQASFILSRCARVRQLA